jgi:hypothetical protein
MLGLARDCSLKAAFAWRVDLHVGLTSLKRSVRAMVVVDPEGSSLNLFQKEIDMFLKLRSLTPYLLVGLFAVFLGAAFVVPLDGDDCSVQVRYAPSTASYNVRCKGTCAQPEPKGDDDVVTRACAMNSFTGPSGTHWNCICHEDENTTENGTKCHSTFKKSTAGVHSIICVKNGCVNDCLEPTLPTAGGVWSQICTCIDV